METLRIETDSGQGGVGGVTTVRLHRPEVRNAFNEVLIAELTETFAGIGPAVRAVILAGEGPAFCAGADVNWLKKSIGYTEAENRRDALAMAGMFRAIDRCPCPVIGRVHGVALGGAMGLIAVCDIVVAADDVQFGFTEVRLGILPAVISTFVLPKIGPAAARRYFLTGEVFGPAAAQAMGLVHEVAPAAALDQKVAEIIAGIRKCGPRAVAEAKVLIREMLARAADRDAAAEHAAGTIARVRVSPEGQEGLGAFLEKRKPGWL
jgi:methylglutaconyl-CoA hydratase